MMEPNDSRFYFLLFDLEIVLLFVLMIMKFSSEHSV